METQRQTLLTRKASLEDEATRVLEALEAVDSELRSLELDIEASTVKEEIDRLNERLQARQRGDVFLRLGETYVTVNRGLIRSLPVFPGILTEVILRLAEVLAGSSFRLAEVLAGSSSRLAELISEAATRISTMLVDLIERIISVIRRR